MISQMFSSIENYLFPYIRIIDSIRKKKNSNNNKKKKQKKKKKFFPSNIENPVKSLSPFAIRI